MILMQNLSDFAIDFLKNFCSKFLHYQRKQKNLADI